MQGIHSIHTRVVPVAEMNLADNLRVHPDILIGNGNGIFGSGVQGTGKTSIMVRILEQASQFLVPMAIFDQEGDIQSATNLFPRGFIATYKNCPTARDIIRDGLQVVYDLSTWPTMDMRGSFIARMVSNLFNIVDGRPPNHRTPCLVGLDEAALFLPQRRGETFSVETYKAMADAFHIVATMGRKRGLTPVLFTQKLSEVSKTVLSPGTYIMLKQIIHTDLKRYLDYIERTDIFSYMTERQICQFVSSLQLGRAIVKLANGEQHVCQFYQRESVHVSHTPSTQAALNLYSSLRFNPDTEFGVDAGEEEGSEVYQEDQEEEEPEQEKKATGAERCRQILRKNPNLRVSELALKAKCGTGTASRVKAEFISGHRR